MITACKSLQHSFQIARAFGRFLSLLCASDSIRRQEYRDLNLWICLYQSIRNSQGIVTTLGAVRRIIENEEDFYRDSTDSRPPLSACPRSPRCDRHWEQPKDSDAPRSLSILTGQTSSSALHLFIAPLATGCRCSWSGQMWTSTVTCDKRGIDASYKSRGLEAHR